MVTTDVLVAGAGPTGLVTALQAHDHGATVRVVERRTDAFRPSRAMIVHPRTMERLRPLGVTDALLERADRSPRAEMHLGHRRVEVALGDVAWATTSFPHLTMVRQADVEAVLAAALAERGVVVERGTELVAASSAGDAAHVVLREDGGLREASCRFVAGCDGAASTVRRCAGVCWHGADYREEVVLADVELAGDLAPGVLHVVVAGGGLVFLFALGEGATWRLLATRRAAADVGGAADAVGPGSPPVPPWEIRRVLAASGLPVTLDSVRWSARVALQHRLAGSFRSGRLFLAGDAAHTHSPAAAQGMNTGILDAGSSPSPPRRAATTRSWARTRRSAGPSRGRSSR
jgi:2-polyprenyl-6-methoxyphenol hydroxylase-like FAD-dependent oxidoreductase